MLEAVRAFEAGEPAIGTGDLRIPSSICAYQAIVPKTTDWRAYPVSYVWDSREPALEPSYSTASAK
jgi:phthalate 4,5-dioxygenase oxygenase subunit